MLSTGKTVALYLGIAILFAFAVLSGIHQAFIINYIQFKISRPLYQVLGVSV